MKTKRARGGQIKLDALSLDVGDTMRTNCPFCTAQDEKSMVITRNEEGLLYHCYRASCEGSSGFISSTIDYKAVKQQKHKKDYTYNGELYPIDSKFTFLLRNKYRILWRDIEDNQFRQDKEGNYLFMPIFTAEGYENGYCAKRLNGEHHGPKSIIYSNDRYIVHYPYGTHSKNNLSPMVVVEDILSSIRVSKFLPCISLLGCDISTNHIVELQKRTKHLILMLDADTWRMKGEPKPIKYKRKYGLCFHKFDLIQVERDPKDSSETELADLLSNYLDL